MFYRKKHQGMETFKINSNWTNLDRNILVSLLNKSPKSVSPWISRVIFSDEDHFLPHLIKYWKKKTVKPFAKENDLKTRRDVIDWFQLYWNSKKVAPLKQEFQTLTFDVVNAESRSDRIARLLLYFRWNNNFERFDRHKNKYCYLLQLSKLLSNDTTALKVPTLSEQMDFYFDRESDALIDLWNPEDPKTKDPFDVLSVLKICKQKKPDNSPDFKDENEQLNDPISCLEAPFEIIQRKGDRICLLLQGKGKNKYFWIVKELQFDCLDREDRELGQEITLEYDQYEKQKYDEYLISIFNNFKKNFSSNTILSNMICFSDIQARCIESFSSESEISSPCILDFFDRNDQTIPRKRYSRISYWICGNRWQLSWIPLVQCFPQEQFEQKLSSQHFIDSKNDWIGIQFQIAWLLLELNEIGIQLCSIHPYQIFLENWVKPVPKTYRTGGTEYSFQENYATKIHPGSHIYSRFGNMRIPNAWKFNKTVDEWKQFFLSQSDLYENQILPSESHLYRNKRMTLIWISCLKNIISFFVGFPCVVQPAKERKTFFEICGLYSSNSNENVKEKLGYLLSCSDIERFEKIGAERKGFDALDIEWVPCLKDCIRECFSQQIVTDATIVNDSILHQLPFSSFSQQQ